MRLLHCFANITHKILRKKEKNNCGVSGEMQIIGYAIMKLPLSKVIVHNREIFAYIISVSVAKSPRKQQLS